MAKKIPPDALSKLRMKIQCLPARSAERREFIKKTANFYGVSEKHLYRTFQSAFGAVYSRREDSGVPRVLTKEEMRLFCEVIAALKYRSLNVKKARCMSTEMAIDILEKHGAHTDKGFIQLTPGTLKVSTVNRYLKKWKLNPNDILKESPAVTFQAENSNDCWHFDLSPSDLTHIEKPSWVREGQGAPILMLYAVVDDRSGACYQEYRCVYGEDTEAALRFLFNAMSQKDHMDFPFQGIPKMIYMDNGPISKSKLFQDVMKSLNVEVKTYLPASKGKQKTTARAKGKVERAFRSVKDMYEVLYRFNKPKTEDQANQWLMNHLKYYNSRDHRSESHSRLEDWSLNFPKTGIQKMCSWETFCSYARTPEVRTVGIDGVININGLKYEVSHELVGSKVTVWWGLIDAELYVECDEKKFGPYKPGNTPIPLHKYRALKKTQYEKNSESIKQLAESISIDLAVMDNGFKVDIDHNTRKYREYKEDIKELGLEYESVHKAKLAISSLIEKPLSQLSEHSKSIIDKILSESLNKKIVIQKLIQSNIISEAEGVHAN